jgi:UDP-N-acetylmuramoyl-tripeptide--D-alanyl-D-alanine ligase
MGANHKKEIEFLCDIAQPDFGYITNFGKAHLEGFGGVEGVIEGKSEMYSYLFNHQKLVFVNLEDGIQVEKTRSINQFTFGLNTSAANVSIAKVTANPFVTVEFQDLKITSNLIGLYNANNINAALAIGNYFEVPNDSIKAALEGYVPENNRSQMISKGTNQIILDAYNANPSSMAVAIENFKQLDSPNKIAILGDMFELGDESLHEHKQIVNSLSNQNEIVCHFVGTDFFANRFNAENFHFHATYEDLAACINEQKINQSTLLIKGSRGMALERTLDLF